MIGVLAVQGAFEAHARMIAAVGEKSRLVRRAEDFDGLDGFVLPGGESTVQLDLIGRLGLEAPLRETVRRGVPVFATCAGLILAARRVASGQRSFAFVDVGVERNAWGRQIESFEAVSDRGRPLVFIRAPRIVDVGAGVEVVDTFRGEPVLVRQRNVTCATFHPELAEDRDVFVTVLASAA